MRNWRSKLLALLLTMVMLLGLTPTLAFGADAATGTGSDPIHVYTEEENAVLDNDVFTKIQAVKDAAAATMGGIGNMTETDYAAIVPQIVNAIKNSDTYVEGSLQQNGSFLVWQTTVGIPCCYSPRMEAELHNTGNDPTPEDIARAEAEAERILSEAAGVKGGWPSSVNIGLIQPYWESTSNYADSSFNGYSPAYKAMWESLNAATGGTGKRYTMTNATVDHVADAVQSCGLVIVDSHGTTDYNGSGGDYTSRANSSYLCLITNAGVTSQDTQAQTGPYGTYYHCIKGSGYAYVDGTCIANHMTQNAPHSLVYLGICLGMATDGMFSGLRSKGVETVWGYSQSVTFSGEKTYMQAILGHVKDGDDYATAVSKAKADYGDWDPAYSNYSESWCVANYVAFPICVSSEDVYPGHGNVDRVQTVKSTWTLYTQFEVTALVNNDAWGTVSVSGSTITAAPATGYYSAGYEVISGDATVTQNGNVFQVNAASDCTIQINFAAKDPAVLSFSVPEGVTCAPISSYLNDDVVLPAPEGAVMAGEYECTFVGWLTAPLEERVSTRPNCLRPGDSITMTSTAQTLYALYGYFVTEEVPEGQYSLVDQEPVNWEDDYVITYNGAKALDASGQQTGTKIGASAAVVNLDSAGEELLSGVPDTLVYRIARDENGSYTVKMKNSDYYLAISGSYSSLNATDSLTDKGRWTLSMENDTPVLTNVAYPTMTLQYNADSNLFRAYPAGTKSPLALYATAKGTTWFTTDPKDPNANELVITGQPADFTGPIGATASFTVIAEGEGLTYQWQYKSLKDGKWHDTKVDGYDTPTMQIGVTAARNGMQFRCKVTDASGSTAISDPATLRVEAVGPTITSQPQDFTGPIGATASFTVAAEGEGLTYQWQYKSLKDGKWYNANVTGSTAATMSIGVTAARNGMQFRCKVTNSSGGTTISDAATLRVG